jgi:hypothetical protein
VDAAAGPEEEAAAAKGRISAAAVSSELVSRAPGLRSLVIVVSRNCTK